MSKNGQVYRVFDNEKMKNKLFISVAVWFLVAIIMITIYQNNCNGMVFPFYVSIFLWGGYIWYSYRTTTRVVDLNEYVKILKSKGKSNEEIARLTNKKEEYIEKTFGFDYSVNKLKSNFEVSNKFITKDGLGIYVDGSNKIIAIIQLDKSIKYISFSEIYSYEIKTNEYSSGAGAMALGALTGNTTTYRLGMANSIVGNKEVVGFTIELSLNDVDSENIDIQLLNKKLLNNSLKFKEIEEVANQITKFLDKIIIKLSNHNSIKSNLGQIKELKELLDMDAITKKEFEEKKKELLGNKNEN